MSIEPLISVIIPAYNAQDFIGETIESILAQSYQNLEIIVVDDGSWDKTADVVQAFGQRVQYSYQENSGGCSVPRNRGIESSSGEFLCFSDADDIMVRDRIGCQVDFMKRNPHVGIVFSDYRNFEGKAPHEMSHFQTCPRLWGQIEGQKELILDNARTLLAQENFGIAGSFMVRRKCLDQEAGFEPALAACEDFHFFFRVARHARVGVINKVGMMRRIHRENMSGSVSRMLLEGIRCRSLLLDNENDIEIGEHLKRYIAKCNSALARYTADQGKFLRSLRYDWRVFCGPFFWSEAARSSRNIVRTLIMASHLYKPRRS